MEIKSVAAGSFTSWVSSGWALYKRSWLTWTLIMIVYMVTVIVLSLIPFVGQFATAFLVPVLFGGMAVTAHNARSGAEPKVGDLFLALSNPAMRNPLLILGAISVGISLISAVVAGGAIATSVSVMDPSNPTAMAGGLGLSVIIAFAITLAGSAALWFAVPLVAISAVQPVDAIKLSLQAALKNIIPLLLFGIVTMILVMLGFFLFVIGALITIPIVSLAHYYSFSEIFGVS